MCGRKEVTALKNFWSYISNGEYSVGCTGQTVFLYGKDGGELGRFKDLKYGYMPMISPDGTKFVVKSTEGRLAVYSLETYSLITKFRFSKVDCAQDDGFCFSPDGKLFLNIERHEDGFQSAIAIYDTADFSLANRVTPDKEIAIEHIEYDKETDTYYILGFLRGQSGGYVARFKDGQIQDTVEISESEHWFYRFFITLRLNGFTPKAHEWSLYPDYELETLKTANHSLAKLYKHYHS